jgi:hypothetical protein
MNEKGFYAQGYRVVQPGYSGGAEIACPDYGTDWQKYIDDCNRLNYCSGFVVDHEKGETCLKQDILDVKDNRDAELVIKMNADELKNRINLELPGYDNVLINKTQPRNTIVCLQYGKNIAKYADACNKNNDCKGFNLFSNDLGTEYYGCLKSKVDNTINKPGYKLFIKDLVPEKKESEKKEPDVIEKKEVNDVLVFGNTDLILIVLIFIAVIIAAYILFFKKAVVLQNIK